MILAILQARMSSSRLPGKVMRPILGQPMIARQLERLGRARRLDRLAVATSSHESDDPLAAWCAQNDVPVFRGALDDVLARFIGAAAAFGPADHIVRLTADCPLADPGVIDDCIALHLETGAAASTNGQPPRSYPDGLDVEVIRAEVLATADREATDPFEREHVTPFIYRQPERFHVAHLQQAIDHSDLRWTVDRAEDFDFVRGVYEALYPAKPDFGSADILALPPQAGAADAPAG